ncbi:hypothetical protein PTTG_29177 [Puccinia triticina 1-1 BBBD Race 1]|uniref:Uncharacterized protein n=1 Tax=Puccinia triticina (isolate 1-1 / race 1 (BBBD)) TaxID=630390 RepID=A0A180G5T2_PUCT1|nr:hypothetical protein PTTG_29177 [Puccinia triticina 1-1 BBBD Race 1]
MTEGPNAPHNSAPATSGTPQENAQRTAAIENSTEARHSLVSNRGRGGRKRGRGSNPTPRGTSNQPARQPPRSWTKQKNSDGKSELDLIIDWLTVKANFSSWRNSSISKRDVCEKICNYSQANGFPQKRKWKGVQQQITGMETKFRKALRWKEQTSQGIMEKARENAQDHADDPDAPNYVEDARNKTEAEILGTCPYFFQLEPVMLGRPSAGYVVTSETRDDQPVDNRSVRSEDIEERAEDNRTSPLISSQSEDRNPESDDDLLPPVLDLESNQQLSQRIAPQASQESTDQSTPQTHLGNKSGNSLSSRKRKTYAKQIAGKFLPSKRNLAADRAVNNKVNQRLARADEQMSKAAASMVSSIINKNAPPAETNSEMLQLQL